MFKAFTQFAEKVEDKSKFWIGTVGRFGYSVKGVIYSTVGILTVQRLFNYTQYKAGSKGAIEAIHDWPLGKFYVIVIIAGLLGYCLWRFIQAITDADQVGRSLKGLFHRFGYICSGLMYGSLAFWTAVYVFSEEKGSEQELIAKVLSYMGGRIIIMMAGVINIGVAIQHFFMAVTASYMKDYKDREMSGAYKVFWKWVGRYGMLGRTAVFGMIGFFLMVVSIRKDPKKSGGLEAGLKFLADDKFGTEFLFFTAFGLMAYGLYCFSRAGHKKFIKE